MYAKHFITMFLSLVLMAILGLGFLAVINHHNHRDLLAGITSSVTAGTSTTAKISK